MLNRRLWIAAAMAGCGSLPSVASAQAAETSGVKFDSAIQYGGTRLLLNGAGTRYKAVFKVYAAGLYLPAKAATPDAVLASPGPRRLQIVMLRDIDANELGRLFTRGMEQNTPRDEFAKSIPGTLRLGDIFAAKKKLLAGETFSVDWLPGFGTSIVVNGKPAGEPIKEPEFQAALLKIWLGGTPADAQLKEALLGHAAVPNPNFN